MQNFLVKFTFEIPVSVPNDCEEANIEAYYQAKDEFSEFSINEADVKIETLTDEQYKHKRLEVNKIHRPQYRK